MKTIRRYCTSELFETYELTIDEELVSRVNNRLADVFVDSVAPVTAEDIEKIMTNNYDWKTDPIAELHLAKGFSWEYNTSVADVVNDYIGELMWDDGPVYTDYGDLLNSEFEIIY